MKVTLAVLTFVVSVAACGTSSPDSADALSCKASRQKIGAGQRIFTDAAKNIITYDEAATGIKQMQHDLADTGAFATGQIRTVTLAASDSLGRLRVAITERDPQALTAAATAASADLTALGAACTTIGA